MEALNIIKIGGAVLNNPDQLSVFLDHFARIPLPKILVHGGGRKANELLQKLDIPLKMVEGRRITDNATLEVAVMVYAGWINKSIVANLSKRQTVALGLSGADLNSILAHKRNHPSIDFGWVGDIESIRSQPLLSLLKMGIVPVYCAITHDGRGQLLNTNADTVATQMAIAMTGAYEVKLWLTFEKKGVLFRSQ